MIESCANGRTVISRLVLCTGACLMLGCADQPTAVDREFGKSMHSTQQAQSIHQRNAAPVYPPLVSDAVSGKAAIERYYKSFESPPPPGNVLNIGVGTSLMTPAAR